MHTVFEEKRQKLLEDFRILALKHNRAYYISLIPFVESALPEQEDMLDMYAAALEVDKSRLTQSRGALMTVQKINILI